MKTKLIRTTDYLLLIDEKTEIKSGNKVWWEDPEDGLTSQLNTAIEIHEDLIFMSETNASEIEAFPHEVSLVIAYYPLTKEAKPLNLPLLPPFEDTIPNSGYEEGMFGYTDTEVRVAQNAFKEGYKTAQQSNKQFSLEDMKIHIEEFLEFCSQNYSYDSTFGWYENGNPGHRPNTSTLIEKYIQSLSTQQLPSEFFPEFDIVHTDHAPNGFEKVLKFKTNSEGKEELVGIYLY